MKIAYIENILQMQEIGGQNHIIILKKVKFSTFENPNNYKMKNVKEILIIGGY